MKRLAALCALVAAAACAPAEEQDNLAAGCDARAVTAWAPAPEGHLSIEAHTVGPDCARAVATLVIRNQSGEPLYADVHVATHVLTLSEAQDEAAMQTALAAWIDPSGNTTMQTSSALPDWPQGAEGPQNGEFPFYPENQTRDSYLALRTANVPIFCYVQGRESLACLSVGDGGIERVGVQLFPG